LVPSAALVALLLAGSASASPMVVIEHSPPEARDAPLAARMTSTAGRRVIEPAAFVRAAGEKEYQRLAMEGLPDDRFSAALPASLSGHDCEYFLEAFDEDGNGPFRKGSPDKPLRLSPSKVAERAARAPAAAVAKRSEGAQRTAGIALLASGAVIVVGGAVAGLMALNDYGIEKSTADTAIYEKSKSAAQAEAMAADVLYGVGAAAVVVGAILWLTDRPRASPSAVSLSAAPARGGACAVLSGRF
jgi:hypothetical protein